MAAATARGLGDSLQAELSGLLGRTGAIEIEPTTDDVPKINLVDVEAFVAKALARRPELAAARARRAFRSKEHSRNARPGSRRRSASASRASAWCSGSRAS